MYFPHIYTTKQQGNFRSKLIVSSKAVSHFVLLIGYLTSSLSSKVKVKLNFNINRTLYR